MRESVDVRRLDAELARAIVARNVDQIARAAAAMRRAGAEVPLTIALDMVVVAGEERDPRYAAWARRWTERFVAERRYQRAAQAEIERLLRLVPRQNAARAVTLALRSYTGKPRTWE